MLSWGIEPKDQKKEKKLKRGESIPFMLYWEFKEKQKHKK